MCRLATLVAIAATGALVASCGSSPTTQSDAVQTPASASPSAPVESASPAETSAPSVPDGVTVILSGTGVSVTERIGIGALILGLPLGTVGTSCALAGEQGYEVAPISITLEETQGAVPENLALYAGSWLGGFQGQPSAPKADLLLEGDGGPYCGNTTSGAGGVLFAKIRPHVPLRLTGIVFLPGAISNAEPQGYTRQDLNQVQAVLPQSTDLDHFKITGPRSAICTSSGVDDPSFLPFSQLPVGPDTPCRPGPKA